MSGFKRNYNKNYKLGIWTSLNLLFYRNLTFPHEQTHRRKKRLLMDRNLRADLSPGWQPLALICWAEVIETTSIPLQP